MRDARTDLARERAVLAGAIRDAGEVALQMFRRGVRHWMKGTSSPVSEADLAVNDLLRERLRQAMPEYGWLSEESADDPARLSCRRVWVVDPIDGTRSFIAGRDDWSVSVALVEDGRPLLAALMVPVAAHLFEAIAGAGARRDGTPIRASAGEMMQGTRIAGPKPLLERLGMTGADVTIVPRIGSLALRLARVAEGALDAAFAGGESHDWDLAAADLLVHEAGGRMTTLDGAKVVYNRPAVVHQVLVAAGQPRHRRLIDEFRLTMLDS